MKDPLVVIESRFQLIDESDKASRISGRQAPQGPNGIPEPGEGVHESRCAATIFRSGTITAFLIVVKWFWRAGDGCSSIRFGLRVGVCWIFTGWDMYSSIGCRGIRRVATWSRGGVGTLVTVERDGPTVGRGRWV